MPILGILGGQIEDYMNLASGELKITAGNMANIDTPDYKTIGIDFPAEMKRALALKGGAEGEGNAAMMISPEVSPVNGLIARPDGNNVSMDREGLKMAEAQLKFRTGVELLKREFTSISDAIHSDVK